MKRFRAPEVVEHESGLATMPNERPGTPLHVEHVLKLPRCCPATRNPQEGSTLSLRYRAGERVLEVYALKAFIDAFKGGHPDGTRNMEAMIQQIGTAAAAALGVRVFVNAHLLLLPEQEMRLLFTCEPGKQPRRHAGGKLLR